MEPVRCVVLFLQKRGPKIGTRDEIIINQVRQVRRVRVGRGWVYDEACSGGEGSGEHGQPVCYDLLYEDERAPDALFTSNGSLVGEEIRAQRWKIVAARVRVPLAARAVVLEHNDRAAPGSCCRARCDTIDGAVYRDAGLERSGGVPQM